jgi:hypothetical protein
VTAAECIEELRLILDERTKRRQQIDGGYRREPVDADVELLVWKLDDLMQRYDVYGERK